MLSGRADMAATARRGEHAPHSPTRNRGRPAHRSDTGFTFPPWELVLRFSHRLVGLRVWCGSMPRCRFLANQQPGMCSRPNGQGSGTVRSGADATESYETDL